MKASELIQSLQVLVQKKMETISLERTTESMQI